MLFDCISAVLLAGSPIWGYLGLDAMLHHSEPSAGYHAPVGHMPTGAAEKSPGVLGRSEYGPTQLRYPEIKVRPGSHSVPAIPWPGVGRDPGMYRSGSAE